MNARWLWASVLAVGCGAGTTAPPPGPTYLSDVQPLVERSCVSCHRAGGVAPFALETPEQVLPKAQALWSSIESQRMPPFFASTDCNSYADDPRLTDDEQATFKAWALGGAALGDKATERHATPITPPTIRQDLVMSTGVDYDVRTADGSSDNYHCFLLDPGNREDLLVSGIDVTPGNKAVVHHLLAYVVAPNQLAQAQALDDAAPGVGYPCKAGGVGVQGVVQSQIASWVPGAQPGRLPPGTGLLLPGGSKVIAQIHYNTNNLTAGGSTTDQTRIALETAPAGTLSRARVLPFLNYTLDIPAGEAASQQRFELKMVPPFLGSTVYSAAGHMHMLGTEVRFEVVRPDSSSQCILHIKKWDFNWQRNYALTKPYVFKADERLRITCTYDNSAVNQPFINGVQQVPRDVRWGENSTDEMCMTYLTFVQP